MYSKINELKLPISAFIAASAVGIYGAQTSEKIFNEEDEPFEDFMGNCCKQWENSVNFPTTILAPQKNSSGARLCIVNRNEPGALGEITTFLGSKGLNISQQINTSRGDIAYTVIDFTNQPEDAEALQAELAAACNFIISLRFLGMVFNDELGEPGTYFYVSWAQ